MTYASVGELSRGIAAWMKDLAEQCSNAAQVQEAIRALESRVWQAPHLSCEIRPSLKPFPALVLLTFRQTLTESETELLELTQAIPALEPPLREHYPDERSWQTACAIYERTWLTWISTHLDDSADAYHHACERVKQLEEERKRGKTLTVEVGLYGRAQRFPLGFIRGLRKAETWRFKPERYSPLEELLANQKPIERLKAQGKVDEAVALEASMQRLAAQMERWPEPVKRRRRERLARGWRPLWIDPHRTLVDDIQFVLVLYALQEQMIEYSPDISRFLAHYMKQFKYAVTPEECELLPRPEFRLEGGGSGFASLLRTYAAPEDAKALRFYIAKTLHGRQASVAREMADQTHHASSLSPEAAEEIQQQIRRGRLWTSGQPILEAPETQGRQLYGVDEVVRLLMTEATEGAWVPSRDTVYDWGNAGLFVWHREQHNKRNRKSLDEEGLNKVRARVDAERAHRNLTTQAEAVAMSRAAIKKAIQRGRLDAILTRKEAERKQKENDEVEPVEALSVEDLCVYLECRLEQPDLTANDREDTLHKLKILRERSDGLGRSEYRE